MSIRNIINDQNKSWLTGNFNNVDANEYEATADDIVTMDGTVDIQLSGAPGTAGQEIIKNGSNQLSWATPTDSAGDNMQYDLLGIGPYTNNTIIYQPVHQFNATGLPVGDYICFFSAEIQNPGAVAYAQVTDLALTQFNEWAIPAHTEFHSICGFQILNVTLTIQPYVFLIRSGIAGQVTTARNIRFFFWKI